MYRAITSLILLIIFTESSHGTRIDFSSMNTQDSVAVAALASPGSNGICETLVEENGYACEEHTVTTQDGFILGLQRIRKGQSVGNPGSRSPILLLHGVIMDGAVWVVGSANESLAFVLADSGFDVWVANTRGTTSSSNHTSLNPDDAAYWDWSWDELVSFDLPVMFQYVHNQTQQKLHFVGHSLGSLIALAAFSKHQQLNMLRSAALLSPVAYASHITSKFLTVGANVLLADASHWLTVAKFDPTGRAVAMLIGYVCSRPGVDCTDMLSTVTGPNCCLDYGELGFARLHGVQPTSTKNVIHLSQMIKEGTMAMYDYNDEGENKRHYGQTTPPVYNISAIPSDVPLFLSCGGADAISDAKDVQLLLESLNGHAKDKLVVINVTNYAHFDFVFGKNAKQVVYDPLLAFLKLY